MGSNTSVNKKSCFEPSYYQVYEYLNEHSSYHLRNMDKIHYAVGIINKKLNELYGPRCYIKLAQDYDNWYGEYSLTFARRVGSFDELKLSRYRVHLHFISSQQYFHAIEIELSNYVANLFKWLGIGIDFDHNFDNYSSTSGTGMNPYQRLPYRSTTHFVEVVNIHNQDMYSVDRTTPFCFDSKIVRVKKPKIDYMFDMNYDEEIKPEKSLLEKIKDYLK